MRRSRGGSVRSLGSGRSPVSEAQPRQRPTTEGTAEGAVAEGGTAGADSGAGGAAGAARSRPPLSLERVVDAGILAGVVGAIVMGAFAMIASATWLHEGLYAPAYRVAFMVETTVLDESI